MALVINRRHGEGFYIGDDIYVHILGENKYGALRIAVEAPRDINIVRKELRDKDEAKGNVNKCGDVGNDQKGRPGAS